ncbi:hypothetical protein DB31_0745 [Hyalangium minutum]|uniref:Uncharacterized protein n=1 Tax=Hyalangium minutum TaxID=394096 RepID=A0A085WXR9_9BACT|nr:hypothetical protein DB31_0745 [Hyalangium minutum]
MEGLVHSHQPCVLRTKGARLCWLVVRKLRDARAPLQIPQLDVLLGRRREQRASSREGKSARGVRGELEDRGHFRIEFLPDKDPLVVQPHQQPRRESLHVGGRKLRWNLCHLARRAIPRDVGFRRRGHHRFRGERETQDRHRRRILHNGLSVLRRPDAQGPGSGAGSEPAAIGREYGGRALVMPRGDLDCQLLGPVRDAPGAQPVLVAQRERTRSIRREADPPAPRIAPLLERVPTHEGRHEPGAVQLQQLDLSGPMAHEEALCRGREREGEHFGVLVLRPLLPAAHVIQAGHPLRRTCRQQPAVRAEGDGVDVPFLLFHGVDDLAPLRLPDLGGRLLHGGEPRAVRTHCGEVEILVALHRPDRLPARGDPVDLPPRRGDEVPIRQDADAAPDTWELLLGDDGAALRAEGHAPGEVLPWNNRHQGARVRGEGNPHEGARSVEAGRAIDATSGHGSVI